MRESNKARKRTAKKVARGAGWRGSDGFAIAGKDERSLKGNAAPAAPAAASRDAARYCTLQTRSVPGVVPQSVPMGVALVIDSQVFD
jgi:hypothetical protein